MEEKIKAEGGEKEIEQGLTRHIVVKQRDESSGALFNTSKTAFFRKSFLKAKKEKRPSIMDARAFLLIYQVVAPLSTYFQAPIWGMR